jgi:hypothetical protein
MPAAHSVTTYLLTRDIAASIDFYGALCGYLPGIGVTGSP